jgi:hypothetical protein|tara:strand:+ start:198 stop:878 length:681 start_codon:yes stop_codon:yes gene_type:complete
MKVLELFAGSRSFSKVAEEMGMETFTTDYKAFDKIDLVIDILDLDNDLLMEKLFEKGMDKVDCVWASPPCTYFSVASIGHHWNKDHTPKTPEAILGVKIVQKTLDIIDFLKPDFFFIENPRGKLRKLEVVKGMPRTTVCYCQYGDTKLKPTDIWSNFIFEEHTLLSLDNMEQGWKPRPMCNYRQKNCICHHEKAPRGSKTGTQGLKGNYERSVVPYELCKEILESL